MKELLLVGGGGHCHSCIDVIETAATFRIAGIVQPREFSRAAVLGYPIVGDDDDLEALVRRFRYAIITVGQIKSPDVRRQLYAALQAAGAVLPVIASPLAHVAKRAEVGAGTMVMHGAVINTNSRIGENAIINSMALVEHDAVVGAHCHISTGARVNGGTIVGDGTFIGSGAVLKNGIAIGAECVVSAGSVIMRDVPPGTFVGSLP